MKIVNSIKSFLKKFYSFITKNFIATVKLLGVDNITRTNSYINQHTTPESESDSNLQNEVSSVLPIRIIQIDGKYRKKNIVQNSDSRAPKLTNTRMYRKGMKVSAYSYNKLTHEIGDKLTESSTIREAAELYMIHPSMVSACAVYNKLHDLYGKHYADCHVRRVKKYITPGTVEFLSAQDQSIVRANTNTITFKYE